MQWWLSVDFGSFAAQSLHLIQGGGHLFVTLWNRGNQMTGPHPVTDFFVMVGYNSVHIIHTVGHATAQVICKGRQIETPVTRNGIDVSSCR